MEEVEVKFLDIDPVALQKKLESIGARKVGEFFYRRYVFDYPDLRLNTDGAWLRLRDEGDKVTLTYKKRKGKGSSHEENDQGMHEVEVEVNDFEKTRLLMLELGLVDKFYEENKRIRWEKDGIEFDIDTWPAIPTYLEIEATRWDEIDKAIRLLELNPDDRKIFSTHQIYAQHGIHELEYSRVTFDGLVKRDTI